MKNDEELSEDVETTPEPLFSFAEKAEIDEATVADPTGPTSDAFRMHVLERDGWQCRYPGCSARRELHVHHIRFRSHGGPDEAWNGVTLCAFHHGLLHAAQIAVKGRAPHALEWTPPKLMREVLERRRNRPVRWTSDLEVVEFPFEAPAVPVSG